jgi:hypothetical protein
MQCIFLVIPSVKLGREILACPLALVRLIESADDSLQHEYGGCRKARAEGKKRKELERTGRGR